MWESKECGTCVCAAAYAHLQLSIITLGDTPHMTNEQDVGAQRWAHLLQDGRQSFGASAFMSS